MGSKVLLGQEYTMAEAVFSDEDIARYKAGDPVIVKLYDMINDTFPGTERNMCCLWRHPALADKEKG